MKAPPPCEFRRSVVIPAGIETVFAFHGDPRNAGKISPGWQSVRVLQGEAAARPDAEFRFEVRFFGLFPMRWHGVWRVVDEPVALMDEALASPFVAWQHRHLFERVDPTHTRMTDHVTYQFPGGWLGKWFGETFGRVQFHLMFADRHRRTVKVFAENGAI